MNATPSSRRATVALSSALVILLVLIVLAGASLRARSAAPIVANRETAPTVAVQRLAPSGFDDTVDLPALIQPLRDVRVSAEKAGTVTALLADKGERVVQGQALLRLDARSWSNAVRQADLQWREAEKDLQRWQEMRTAGAVAASDFDALRMRRDLAAVALDEARLNLNKCELLSPIAGEIVERYLERGEHAVEGAPAFRLVDVDPIKVAFDVPERHIAAVRAGQALPFRVDALPGVTFTGEVIFVAVAATAQNNAFPVELRAANPARQLRPGMIARVALPRATRAALLILPLTALLPKNGEYVVFVAQAGTAARRIVKVEAIQDKFALIASGLSAGEEVVVEGNRTLSDGMPIVTVPAPENGAGAGAPAAAGRQP
jgi:membrane fusion protein (multidrug efflux system)